MNHEGIGTDDNLLWWYGSRLVSRPMSVPACFGSPLSTQVCGLRTLSLATLPQSQLSIKMVHIAAYYDAETILMVTV